MCICFPLILFVLCLNHETILAQGGSIRGKVIDEDTGEDIVGATITIKQKQLSALSDLDGNFIFLKVPQGTYEVECNYLGYGTQKVLGAKVEDDGVKLVYFKLKQGAASDLGLDVVVTAEAAEYMEAALLSKRKKSLKFLETMSSEEILRLGDETVAESAKRIASITIERDQYLYVRGLGGRYVKTLVNGSEIAQFDLSYANIGLDLYPSSILENIVVYKNFSADMPGSFAGGALNINTKTFPDKLSIQLDFSTEYNSISTFKSSFLGFKTFGTPFTTLFIEAQRAPEVVNRDEFPHEPNVATTPEATAMYNEFSQAFSSDYSYVSRRAIPNLNASISIGSQVPIKKSKQGGTIGFNVVGLLANAHNMYENGITGRYRADLLNGGIDTALYMADNIYQTVGQLTLMGNVSIKFSPRHKIRLVGSRTQRSVQTARLQDGVFPDLNPDWLYHNRTWQFDMRRQASGQLSGQHLLDKEGKNTLNWYISLANSLLQQPDLRYFSYASATDKTTGQTQYFLADSIGQAPSHYFRHAEEWAVPFTLDLVSKLPLGTLRTGIALEGHVHIFNEFRYLYTTDNAAFNGNPADYTNPNNFIVWDDSSQNTTGTHIYDACLATHQYLGIEFVGGAYALWDVDISKKLKGSVGFRAEYVNNNITSLENDWVHVQYPAFMPSLALNYEMKKDMFLRFSFGRTTVRPSFREYTNFTAFDFIGDYQIIGNRFLQPSPVNNIDLRWEWYMGLRELLAVGVFFKHFANPIERYMDINTQQISFRNAPVSFLAGIEVELRKDFGFLGEWGKKLSINTNAAYIYSVTNIPEFELSNILSFNSAATDTRPLFGQSPFVVNVGLAYRDDDAGTQASLSFNVAGKRLLYEFADGTPDIYELPKPNLDVNFTQKVGKYIRLRFTARNLLGAQQQEAHLVGKTKYYYRRYDIGQSFLFGISFAVK